MDKAPERYLTQLRRALVCLKEDRERLMADARDMLENFAQENPGAFYRDYVASFGTPEDFAAEMLASLDPEDVAEAQTRRRRTLVGMVTAVGVLLVLLVGFWFGRQSQSRPPAETPGPIAAETPVPTAADTPAPTVEPTAQPTAEPDPAGDEEPGPSWEDCAAYLDEVCAADSGEIDHKRAVAVLIKLGVMTGNEEGEFGPERTVTRAEAARLATLVMLGGVDRDNGVKAVPSFSDIQGHWAESYIEFCFDIGFVFPGEDGMFHPGDTITGLEVVRMALCMLGYDAEAYRLKGDSWAVRTDELARTMDPSLYAELGDVIMSAPVTREVLAQIFYNALGATPKRVTPNYNTTEGTVTWQYVNATRSDGTPATLLWERFGLDSLEDITFD